MTAHDAFTGESPCVLGTHDDNMRDAQGRHCRSGRHLMSGDNLRFGARACRECHLEYQRTERRKERA
jgi:hypothetical protein